MISFRHRRLSSQPPTRPPVMPESESSTQANSPYEEPENTRSDVQPSDSLGAMNLDKPPEDWSGDPLGTKSQDRDVRGPEDTFNQMVRTQSQQRREASAAFAAKNPAFDPHELIQQQQTYARRVTELQREVHSLRRAVQTGIGLAVIFVAISIVGVGTIWFRPETIAELIPNAGLPENSTASGASANGNAGPIPDIGYQRDLEFKIRTDVDRKYQRGIRQLDARARQIVTPIGTVDDRATQMEAYVTFMSDVLRVAEEAQKEQASPEILTALRGLFVVAKARYRGRGATILDPETADLDDQIKMVIRAPDLRGFNSEQADSK